MSIALHDGRPFFEKALTYGIAHGLLSPGKLDAINADAPKGMVQIARYFGTEFLRPELERARERMVTRVRRAVRQQALRRGERSSALAWTDEVAVKARDNGKGPRHVIWFALKR